MSAFKNYKEFLEFKEWERNGGKFKNKTVGLSLTKERKCLHCDDTPMPWPSLTCQDHMRPNDE